MTLVDMSEYNDREKFIKEIAKEMYPDLDPNTAYFRLIQNDEYYKMCFKLYDELSETKETIATIVSKEIYLHCPGCGYGFTHELNSSGKTVGGVSGASAGAILGAKVGIAMGPFGAIAGTIPGAVLGAIFGKNIGNNYDKPRCPSCGIKFEIPNSLI